MEDSERDASFVRRARALQIPFGIFVLTAVLMSVDTLADLAAGATHWHVGLEAALAFLAAAGAVLLWRERDAERRLRSQSEAALTVAHASARQWQASAQKWRESYETTLQGLGEAIDAQFTSWHLTPAESDVALLVLKGLAFKEIAAVRGGSERTVRQQANAAYKKAGLAGRAELSAYFLEDLLLPRKDG